MIDVNKYRQLFPHLPGKLYFNHAAISPMNNRARQAVEDFFNQRTRGNLEFWPDAVEKKQQFVEMIGRLINASPENIALVPNTSAGLNILALGLDWKPGDRILLNDFEFPSNVIPFLNVQRLGVEVDFVHHRNGRIELDDIEKSLHPATRLLSISFVEFLNGYRNDLRALSRICRERDVFFAVDAIQGIGALQVEVEEMGIDFMASGGHKWLMWPAGLGFVYIAPRIFRDIYPAQAGWLSLETPWEFFNYRQDFAPDARRFEPGTFNTTAIIAASATLEMMLEIGPAVIEKKVLENSHYLLQNLQQRGYHLYSDPRPERCSGIVTFYHSAAETLFNYLKDQQITVSLREGNIRVSPHFYNTNQDIDRFLEALQSFEKNHPY